MIQSVSIKCSGCKKQFTREGDSFEVGETIVCPRCGYGMEIVSLEPVIVKGGKDGSSRQGGNDEG